MTRRGSRQCSVILQYLWDVGCLGDRRDACKQLLSPPPTHSAIFHTTHVSFADYDIIILTTSSFSRSINEMDQLVSTAIGSGSCLVTSSHHLTIQTEGVLVFS